MQKEATAFSGLLRSLSESEVTFPGVHAASFGDSVICDETRGRGDGETRGQSGGECSKSKMIWSSMMNSKNVSKPLGMGVYACLSACLPDAFRQTVCQADRSESKTRANRGKGHRVWDLEL